MRSNFDTDRQLGTGSWRRLAPGAPGVQCSRTVHCTIHCTQCTDVLLYCTGLHPETGKRYHARIQYAHAYGMDRIPRLYEVNKNHYSVLEGLVGQKRGSQSPMRIRRSCGLVATLVASSWASSCPFGCSGHGRCHGSACICERGFTGPACALVEPACPHACSGRGYCNGEGCVCEEGYGGPDCGRVTSTLLNSAALLAIASR